MASFIKRGQVDVFAGAMRVKRRELERAGRIPKLWIDAQQARAMNCLRASVPMGAKLSPSPCRAGSVNLFWGICDFLPGRGLMPGPGETRTRLCARTKAWFSRQKWRSPPSAACLGSHQLLANMFPASLLARSKSPARGSRRSTLAWVSSQSPGANHRNSDSANVPEVSLCGAAV